MLNLYQTKPRMALLEATLQALKTTNNDRAISILTQTFYKS
jgi:hypothetical protein